MNHKLLYVLIFVFVLPAQKIGAMDGKNYQRKQTSEPIVFNLHNVLNTHYLYSKARENIIKDAVASIKQLETTDYAIAKSEKTDKNDWPEVFGVIKRNKDNNVKNPIEQLILSDENITTLHKWRKKYENELKIWERIKRIDQPESWNMLALKGSFATLWPIAAGYGMCRLYRILPPEGTYSRCFFWADVVGITIFSVMSIRYGIPKLNLALNYKGYKVKQNAEVAKDNKTIENIKTKFLMPLNTAFEKLEAAIKIKESSITLKEDELYQIKTNKVSLLND